MTKAQYGAIAQYISARPPLLKLLRALVFGLPVIDYAAYPLLLAYLALGRDERIWRVLIVPAAAFALVTVFRRCLNFPRPYEKYGITPLTRRDGKGQSFPSRHAASAAVIAAVFLYVWTPAGIVLSVIALLIAAVRPIAGLHFPRDVIAGLILGYLIGLIGFRLIV